MSYNNRISLSLSTTGLKFGNNELESKSRSATQYGDNGSVFWFLVVGTGRVVFCLVKYALGHKSIMGLAGKPCYFARRGKAG